MVDAAAASSIQIGTVLAGTYRVTSMIGRGGMGAVFAAEHTRLPGKKVAIKVLHAEVAGDHDSLARFRREAEIASRLGHANIVDVHDFNFLDDGTPYLILEFLNGEDMAARLKRGPMALDQVSSIVRQIGSALQAAHAENIIHRDLKPQNVFLCPVESGGVVTEQAKVLDFGISKIRGSQTVKTQAQDMLGTPQYMAPEQATGDHAAVDARTDVFALGAMVYEMLSGTFAFGGQTIPEVVFKVVYEEPPNLGTRVAVPPGVVDAVHKALAKKQAERFPDMSAFVEALTGSPLTTLRKGSAVVAPSDGTPSDAPTAQAAEPAAFGTDKTQAAGAGLAMAATIDSGKRDISAQVVAGPGAVGPAATAPPTPPPGLGTAPAAIADTAAPAVVSHAAPTAGPATTTSEPTSRRSALVIGIAAALSAAVAAVVAVILLSGGSSDKATDEVAQTEVVEAAETDPGSEPGTPVETTDPKPEPGELAESTDPKPEPGEKPAKDVKPDPKPKPVAKPAKDVKPVPKKDEPASKPAPAAAGPADEKLRADLKEAEAALRSGDADEAIHLARRTLGTRQTGVAYAIMARGYCLKQDLGMAKSVMPRVRGRRIKRAVVKYCRAQGVDVAP